MDTFFNTLAQTGSKDVAMAATRKALLRRKLDVQSDGYSYEEGRAHFLRLRQLAVKEKIIGEAMAHEE